MATGDPWCQFWLLGVSGVAFGLFFCCLTLDEAENSMLRDLAAKNCSAWNGRARGAGGAGSQRPAAVVCESHPT